MNTISMPTVIRNHEAAQDPANDFWNFEIRMNTHIGFYSTQPGELRPSKLTILDYDEARDDGIAVILAESYANHLHFAPER